MKTNILKQIRPWALVLCCVLLGAAHAQGKAAPAADSAHQDSSAARDSAADADRDSADDQDRSDQDRSDQDHSEQDRAEQGHAEQDQGDKSTQSDSDTSSANAPQRHSKHRHHDRTDGDVVSIGHNAELPAGQHADTVVAVFGSSSSAGDVGDSVVSVFGNVRVTGGKVGNAVVAVMGSAYINGEVGDTVVAIFGNVQLGPEAHIRGDIVIIGGELHKDPAATIDGHVETIFSLDWSNFEWLQPWIHRCLLYGRPLAFGPGLGWAWGIALGLLALYAFMALAFRGAVESCVHTLRTKPGNSILAAIFTMLLTPVLFVLLCITVLGIAAIPFLALGLLVAGVFGKVVVLAFIGRSCTPMLAKDPVAHTVVGVLVGGAIALLIYTIPVIGFIVYKLLGILGFGVVVYTLLMTLRSTRQARTGAGGGSGAPPNGAGPGAGPAPGIGPGSNASTGAAGLGEAHAVGGSSSSEASMYTGRAMGYGPAGASAKSDFGPSAGGAASSGGFASGSAAASSGAGEASASSPGAGAGGAGHGDASVGGSGAPGGGSGAGGGGAGAAGPANGGPPRQTPSVAAMPRAGFSIRMAALLLDILLVGIVLHNFYEGTRMELLVLASYGAVMWKLKAATIGGIICGLRVERLDGRPIDWPTAIARALGCFLSLAAVGLGFFWIAIDSDRQAWHDKIAGTVVVRAPKGASLL